MNQPVHDKVRIEQQLERIRAHNTRLRALITEPQPHSLWQQVTRSAAQPDSLLGGMTLSIKDNIDTDFAPTTAGAAFWQDRQPAANAVVVQRMLAAGGIPMGKANMTELAWGVRSDSATGGQCLNPLDERRIAGGSSGGSAASVAAGFCDASLGTDTGGSTRIPAAFCGLYGLRPTYGALPNTGVLPLSSSHDTVGIVARSVDAVARIFTALAGYCPQDPASRRQPPAPVWPGLQDGVAGLRIGIPENYYFAYCTEEISQQVMQTARFLQERGATLVSIDLPDAITAFEHAACIMSTEVSSLYDERLRTAPDSISAPVRQRMLQAYEDYGAFDVARAHQFRARWRWQLARLYGPQVDLSLIPATPTTAPLLNDERSLLQATRDLARNTYPSALAGIPSLAVPCGQSADGMPIGLLLESAWGREDLLLRVARTIENSQT
ncbi:MAG TPA: amidase [Paenalcaligenes sp.]|nr:amidase [Paenalcaligenes sp.]